jgi:alkanesulfonate monooxygenase SsuD/methylene tetrahydromethanopterin reductase-like flavin-dependent oxidoreductase (luciferase family)
VAFPASGEGITVHLGVQLIFQSFGYDPPVTDGQVYDEELEIAIGAEELGFDSLWPVEHHFTDYAFCPDNVVYLAHLAARTSRILLGTGAVILPWNQPIRVAEKIAMLDHLAKGRVLFGMGRGLARREYDGMGIAMDEARGRFDESAQMILDALETGFIEGNGPYYPQARTPIRPAPTRSFADRKYSVAMSPDSVDAAVQLGTRMVTFMQKPAEEVAKAFTTYRDGYRQRYEKEAPRPVVCQFIYCDRDPARAEAKAREHITGYLHSLVQHYELASDHFDTTKGYESYGETVGLLKALGLETLCEMYLSVQAYGTPEQVIERTHMMQEVVGPYDLTCVFRYAGISIEEAKQSMQLFAEEVMPTLRTLT